MVMVDPLLLRSPKPDQVLRAPAAKIGAVFGRQIAYAWTGFSMLPRSAAAPLVFLALVLASSWQCSSHEAIVILTPAGADADANTTKTATSTNPDTRPDTVGGTNADTSTSTRADTSTSTKADTSTSDLPDTGTVPAGLPFRDDFTDGFTANWRTSASNDGPVTAYTENGNGFVRLDASANADFSRLRANLDGSLFSDVDIAAAMRFRVEGAANSTQLVRLDVRQAKNTENIFFAVGATVSNDPTKGISITRVGIYKKVDKRPETGTAYTICSLADTRLASPVPIGEWRTIKLTVTGTSTVHLVASFEDDVVAVATATADDDCAADLLATDGAIVPNGGCLADQTGLGIQVEEGITASVDWVHVTKP
jgi:hypothetical protein